MHRLFSTYHISCTHNSDVYLKCMHPKCTTILCPNCIQYCNISSGPHFCPIHINDHYFPCIVCKNPTCDEDTRTHDNTDMCSTCYDKVNTHPSAFFEENECFQCKSGENVTSCIKCKMKLCTECGYPCDRYWDHTVKTCSDKCGGRKCDQFYCGLCYRKFSAPGPKIYTRS